MIDESLKITMTSLVSVLRELLANMEEEHYAILVQDAPAFEVIMHNRTPLLNSMEQLSHSMESEIDKLKEPHFEYDSEEKLQNLAQLAGVENIEILTLRDQILALSQQMEKQNNCNNVLLGNRITEDTAEKENYFHQYKTVKFSLSKKQENSSHFKKRLQTIDPED